MIEDSGMAVVDARSWRGRGVLQEDLIDIVMNHYDEDYVHA